MVVFLGMYQIQVITNNLGTSGINWVSEDCGANIRALNAGKKIEEFMFHPT
jgi:hypothetical protein